MTGHEIEAWALRVIQRVEKRQPIEDSRVELKGKWLDDPWKAARRIAGHANAARGESILWLVGIDESSGVIGASQIEFSDWWSKVKAQFDGPAPQVRDVCVDAKGHTIVALYFEADRFPYVIKNPRHGNMSGAVQREVPWREATAIRSATHSDLILLLEPLRRPTLNVEIGNGRGFVNQYPLAQPVGRSTAVMYGRVKVLNTGRRIAMRSSGYLANVEVLNGKRFRATEYADYLRLVWSHHPGQNSLDLLPDVPHWLDVVSTLENDERFFLETIPKPAKYAGGFDETTTYRLDIRVFAEEAEPVQKSLYLRWKGQWDSLDLLDETGLEKVESRKRRR